MKTTSFIRSLLKTIILITFLGLTFYSQATSFFRGNYSYYQINPVPGSLLWESSCYNDKTAPGFQIKEYEPVSCTQLQNLTWSYFLNLSDNCTSTSRLSITHTDSIDLNCDKSDLIVYRRWKVRDQAGNSTTINLQIIIEKADLYSVVFPPDIHQYCPAALDLNSPVLGVPTYNGEPISHFCGLTVEYKDRKSTLCGNSSLITRHWTIFDCCTFHALNHDQDIYLHDTTKPVFVCPSPILYKTNVKECYSHQYIPGITVTDACNPTGIIVKVLVDQFKTYLPGQLVILSAGQHSFEYQVTDACGNTSKCTVPVTVVDGQGPLLACTSLEVCLITDSIRIGPGDLITEYWDDCLGLKKVSLKIRKLIDLCGNPFDDLVFRDSVTICCVSGSDVVQVVIEATDANGNKSYCNADVYVTNKIPIDIECKDTVIVNCDDDIPNLVPEVNFCGDYDLVEKTIFDNRDSNGIGTLIKRFIVTTEGGMKDSCQTVFIIGIGLSPFGADDLTCPPTTVNLIGCELPPNLNGIPGIGLKDTAAPCAKVRVTLQLDTFVDLGSPCLRITRTWTIIDLLQPGLVLNCIQNIDILDTVAPVLSGIRDTTVFTATCDKLIDLPPLNVSDCDTGVVVINSFNAQGRNIGPVTYPLGTTRIKFIATDKCGNSDSLSIQVTVIDTSGFNIICQNDTTINCGAVFVPGNAIILASCTQVETNVLTADTIRNNCSITNILFKRVITDTAGRQDSCTFTVTFRAADTLFCNQISWPKDTTLTTCGKSLHPDSLNLKPVFSYIADACSKVVVSYKDTSSSANGGGVCVNITRRIWTVSDTCAIPPIICRDTQLIRVTDNTPPVLKVPKDTCVYLKFDSLCDTLLSFLGSATAMDCDPNVTIKSVVIGKTDTTGASLVRRYGLGDTRVLVIALDACGNSTRDTVLVQVKDTVIPNASCKKSNNYFNDQALVRIHARQFNGGSTDNCTAPALLRFSWTQNLADTILEVNCDHIKILRAGGDLILDSVLVMPFERNFNLWVTDESGNQDTCLGNRFLAFFDTLNLCGKNAIVNISGINGNVAMENGNSIPNVILSAIGSQQYQHLSDVKGSYAFEKIIPGRYKIFPYKNDDVRSGISTADLIAIQRHLLGNQLFEKQSQFIAADVNHDNTITAVDLIELRKVILGIYEVFPENTSWRFFDQNSMHKLTDPVSMKEMETPMVEAVEKKTSLQNFTGVKIGDVNESVSPQMNSLETRGKKERKLTLPSWKLKAGDVIELPIKLDLVEVIAAQASIHFSGMELLGVKADENTLIKPNQFAENKLTGGFFNFSWLKSGTQQAGISADILVKLIVKANRDVNLIDQVSLLRSNLAAEAYLEDGSVEEIKLHFDRSFSTVSYEKRMVLNQNSPNPFGQRTTIRFAIPEAGDVKWTFMDIAGRTLKTWTQHYEVGSHEIRLDKDQFNTSGIVYYRLDYHGYSAVRKMILME